MLMFLKNVTSPEEARRKICSVVDDLRGRLSEKVENGRITCSFGLALYPEDGENFFDLYQRADVALYYAKREKDTAIMFRDIRMQSLDMLVSRELTEIEPHYSLPIGLFETQRYVRSFLDNAPNLFVGIQDLLAEIGAGFDLSRVYIFEDPVDAPVTVNTFEWCNKGVEPMLADLQALPHETMMSYYQELEQNDGLFYCYDANSLSAELRAILEPQNIQSMLYFALNQGGKQIGRAHV